MTRYKRSEKMNNTTITQSESQYSLAKILGIWAAAAVPMAIIIHSLQSVFFLFLILGLVLGLA
jgi:hypothetical protein